MQADGSKRFSVALIAVTFVVYLASRYATIVSYTDLRSTDGAFQTLSAVMRYSSGQVPIRDFYPYLGIGVSASLVPVYLLTGQHLLLSSNLSVAAMLFLANVAGLACLFGASGFRLRGALIATFAVLAVNGFSAFEAGNSLRPLRGALPLIVVALLHLTHAGSSGRSNHKLRSTIAWGLCLSVAPLWSNDFGPATTLAFLMAWVLFAPDWRRHAVANGGRLMLILAIVIAVNDAVIMAMGGLGRFLEIQNGFGRDQFWYFGFWGTGFQVFSLDDLRYLFYPPLTGQPLLLGATPLVLLAVAIGIVVRRLRSRAARGDEMAFAVALATAGGVLIPQLGGHIEAGYTIYALNAAAALLVIAASRLPRAQLGAAGLADRRLPLPRLRAVRLGDAALLGLCLVTCGYFTARGAYSVYRIRPIDRDAIAARQAIGVFPKAEAADVACFARVGALFDAYQVPRDRRMMSTYLSALNLAARASQPMKVDSVIHLLGDRFRAENLALIARSRPVLFTTVSPEYTPWDRWNERTSWPVFSPFYRHYEPVARTTQHVIWARMTDAEAARQDRVTGGGQALPCSVRRQGNDRSLVEIDAGPMRRPVWAQVTLDQAVSRTGRGLLSPFRAILTARESPDPEPFVALPAGPLPPGLNANRYGLDKDRHPLVIPFDADAGERSRIALQLVPSTGWRLQVKSCTATIVAPQRLDPLESIPRLGRCDPFLATLSARMSALGYHRSK